MVKLGLLVITAGARDVLEASHQSPVAFLARHALGDWGEVCAADARLNDQALGHGGRLLSAYTTSSGTKLWIITEADRSATTILLPEEY
jgi:hypothetical protein